MKQYVWILAIFVIVANVESRIIVKRDAEIDPLQDEIDNGDSARDKRKVDAAVGVKNAILGFVFNKLNSFIDQKTAWIDHLDQTNIAKNKAHNIYPPSDPVVSLSGIISGAIGQKLQAAAPLISVVTNKLTAGSSSGGGHPGFNIGALFSKGLGGGVAAAPAVPVHGGGAVAIPVHGGQVSAGFSAGY